MRALFLDRDGVVNIDHGHVGTRERFEFMPGIFELGRTGRRLGYEIFLVTNQAGIARGLYSEKDFLSLMEWVREQFALNGSEIKGVYHCPHHPEFGIDRLRKDCDCRKPKPGMILRAVSEHGIDVVKSVMVGDSETDMAAAASAGIPVRILVGKERVTGATLAVDNLSACACALVHLESALW